MFLTFLKINNKDEQELCVKICIHCIHPVIIQKLISSFFPSSKVDSLTPLSHSSQRSKENEDYWARECKFEGMNIRDKREHG